MSTVEQTIQRAQRGYLNERIDLDGLEGVALHLSSSINNLMQVIYNAMQDVTNITIITRCKM